MLRKAIFCKADRRDIDITKEREGLGTEAREILELLNGSTGRMKAMIRWSSME